ncbi:MAG: hypothetical protein ACRCUP_00130 [Mycoplasmatales bacterium]
MTLVYDNYTSVIFVVLYILCSAHGIYMVNKVLICKISSKFVYFIQAMAFFLLMYIIYFSVDVLYGGIINEEINQNSDPIILGNYRAYVYLITSELLFLISRQFVKLGDW